MSKAKPYADVKAKVRTYEKDGKEKGVYVKVGTLFASDNFNNMFIAVDAFPVSQDWNGILSVYPIEDRSENKVERGDNDKPTDLSDIGF